MRLEPGLGPMGKGMREEDTFLAHKSRWKVIPSIWKFKSWKLFWDASQEYCVGELLLKSDRHLLDSVETVSREPSLNSQWGW